MLKVSGIEALGRIKAINPAIPVIIMTAYSSIESAVSALKAGAYDYLTKPLDFDKLRITIERAMEHIFLREENRMLRQHLDQQFDRRQIIGQSLKMERLLETVAQVASSEATILIHGESGHRERTDRRRHSFQQPPESRPFHQNQLCGHHRNPAGIRAFRP